MSVSARISDLFARARAMGVFDNRVRARPAVIATTVVRILGGLLFILSALPKLLLHQQEVEMFVSFGLPRSSALVYLVATAELFCAVLLIVGLFTRLAAVAMAVTMTGAFFTAGLHVGGPIHLGLGPSLLAAMLYLLWAGPGGAAIDRRWARMSSRAT